MATITTKYIVDNLPEQTIGGSLSAMTFSADTFYGDGSNLTGVSGGSFTGGTVSGETIFDGGLSATTFSATTIDLCTSNGTLYTDSISGCSPINILSPANFTQGISADTIYVSGNPITQPYKVYTALLTQTGNTAPEAIVLENTLGVNISYSYVTQGTYHINSDQNIFTEDNLVVLTGSGNVNFYPSLWIAYNGPAQLFITAYNMLELPTSFSPQNDILYKQYIEIRVYN